MPTIIQKQHVEFYRKVMLRKKLLIYALPGAAYVPFIGDGDLAIECLTGRKLYGADIAPDRVERARERLPDAIIKIYDCNFWPFGILDEVFSIADFDAYSHPYAAFISFWHMADKAQRVVLFFTDGHRQAINRLGIWNKPDGTSERNLDIKRRRELYNFYYRRFIRPWLDSFIVQEDYHILREAFYLRKDMLYFGVVIEHV